MRPTSPDPVDLYIGRRIRLRRAELGISQEKLAAGLGVTFQQVQKYEKAKNRVAGARLAQVGVLLKVEVGYFFDGAPGPVEPGGAATPDSPMDAFMASREGMIIAQAFCAIPDPKVRRIVAQAVRQVSRLMQPRRVMLRAAE